MSGINPERITIIVLSAVLLSGSFLQYQKHFKKGSEIYIEKGEINPDLSLKDVEAMLIEQRRVNINSAGPDKLIMIPGIGEKMAEVIIAYREINGCFYNEDDLLNIKGIGLKKVEKMKAYIKFE